jgi:hypothetical protein
VRLKGGMCAGATKHVATNRALITVDGISMMPLPPVWNRIPRASGVDGGCVEILLGC